MIYNRLLSLYKRQKNTNKTPLEDFTTEILVGILEKDQELLDKYVNEILKIDGSNYNIYSQVKYSLLNEKDCIIDIVIKNENTICFIENKVNSLEGERQLERYSKLLKIIKQNEDKSVYLRYCTRFYDQKNLEDINFMQYRWSDVYNFLDENMENNNLIEEYLEFLKEEGMSSAGEFDYQDLIVMSTINSSIAKMDECLDNVKDTLINCFGKPYERDNERLKEIAKSEAYKMWVNDIIGDKNSRIDVGFTLQNRLETQAPFLSVDLVVDSNNNKYEYIISKKEELENLFDVNYSDDDRILFSFEKSLCEFITKEQQITLICDWFNEKINKVKSIIDSI